MPIGSPITLDLPTANDSFAVWSAKMKTAIQTIEEILEAKVTAGSLDITTALSVGGSYITNLSYIKLTEQDITTPTGEGVLYLDADGELVIITADGSVKLTEGGAINVAAINGIGGDYGGANPAIVSYDTLSGEYRFYENGSGTYATLAANDAVLRNNPAPGSVRIGPTSAVTTDLEMYVATLPDTGVGGLAYDQSIKAIVDATETRETETHLFTAIDVSGATFHGERKHVVTPNAASTIIPSAGVTASNTSATPGVTLVFSSAVSVWIPLFVHDASKRIKNIILHGSSAQTPTLGFSAQDGGAFVDPGLGTVVLNSFPKTLTLSSPWEMWDNPGLVGVPTHAYARIDGANGQTLFISNIEVTLDSVTAVP